MILTLLGNRRRILDAAQKAAAQARQKAWQEGWREGVEIGRREARQEMADWYEYAKAEFAADRDPGPPPILNETGNQPS